MYIPRTVYDSFVAYARGQLTIEPRDLPPIIIFEVSRLYASAFATIHFITNS